MKKLVILSCMAAFRLVAVFFSCNPPAAKESAEKNTPLDSAQLVQRGQYIVNSSGCDDCHSPKIMGPQGPVPDPERRLSGHPSEQAIGIPHPEDLKQFILFDPGLTAYIGPWGTSFSANLTSDPTGIGNWNEAQFLLAFKHGKYKGMENGRSILPPMPWKMFANFTDEDAKAVFAFLKTTKPVKNSVPTPIPPAGL